jgi:hypothetical protein
MEAKAPLRIAILEAGYPPERAAAKYGNYGSIFASFLEASVAKIATPEFPGLEVTKWDVQKLEQYPSLDDIDAVLISGSGMSPIISYTLHPLKNPVSTVLIIAVFI